MLISHGVDGDTLRVTLHHSVDVHTRSAAAAEIEALVHTHRPRRVTVQVPAGEPTPATLSVVVRAHRMCKNLDIPLSLTGATTAAQHLFATNTA
jgi:predicted TIM-barrel fold metal-dependent hydrolase